VRRIARDGVTLRVYPQGELSGNKPNFYTRDHLGSIREMFGSTGTVVARYDYDPYGRSTTILGTTPTDMTFTGLYRHSKSNLDLAVHRAYDADLGRWLSRDPLQNAEMTQGSNLYAYVGNDTINGIDPLGLWQFTIGGAYGIGVNITFGHNNGQWNLSAIVGLGLGFAGSFNPNDNTVGHVGGDTVNLGITAQATGGAAELLEASGGLTVSAEASKCNDYWWGTTVNGGFGNMYLGEVSGSAWAGGTGNPGRKPMRPSVGSSSNGWGWSGGGLFIVGGTGGFTWH
jgi:RHS repeat-associated protein